jgi:hypothetical protein
VVPSSGKKPPRTAAWRRGGSDVEVTAEVTACARDVCGTAGLELLIFLGVRTLGTPPHGLLGGVLVIPPADGAEAKSLHAWWLGAVRALMPRWSPK